MKSNQIESKLAFLFNMKFGSIVAKIHAKPGPDNASAEMSVVGIAFIAIPPRFEVAEWSSIIEAHAGTLVCVSLTPPPNYTTPLNTEERWKKMVSEAAAATENKVHINGSFATMWDSDLYHCSDFCALQVDGQDDMGESFLLSLNDNATEHVNLKCVHANCPKLQADACIQKAFAHVGKLSPYIIGGNFTINTSYMDFTVGHAARLGTISSVPLVVPAKDNLWPQPMILVRGSDTVDPSTASQSHCAQLLLQVHGDATEHTPTRAGPAGSQGASSATGQLVQNRKSPLVDVIILSSAFLAFRFPDEHVAEVTNAACDAADKYNYAEESLNKLAEIADHFFFDKQGFAKDSGKMIQEMLHADMIRRDLKEELHTEGHDADLGRREVTTCFKRWAVKFFATQLTPRQRRDKKYTLKYDVDGNVKLTGFQRSFVGAMLRKHMSSKFVANAIWQIGLAAFLRDDAQDDEDDDPQDIEHLLQSCAQTMTEWLDRLGRSIHEHRTQNGIEEQRRLSGTSYQQSGLTESDLARRQEHRDLQTAIARGKRLREEVDDETVKFEELDSDDQDNLNQYDTGALHSRIAKTKVRRLRQFRA